MKLEVAAEVRCQHRVHVGDGVHINCIAREELRLNLDGSTPSMFETEATKEFRNRGWAFTGREILCPVHWAEARAGWR